MNTFIFAQSKHCFLWTVVSLSEMLNSILAKLCTPDPEDFANTLLSGQCEGWVRTVYPRFAVVSHVRRLVCGHGENVSNIFVRSNSMLKKLWQKIWVFNFASVSTWKIWVDCGELSGSTYWLCSNKSTRPHLCPTTLWWWLPTEGCLLNFLCSEFWW